MSSLNLYSRRFRAKLDGIVEMRVRSEWFENYETNKPLIKHGVEALPLVETAVVVGAGWSLKKNIGLLKGLDVPLVVCDKALKRVMEYAKPTVVVALNTARTEVDEWLDIGPTDIILLAPVTAHPCTFSKWQGPIAFVNPQNTCGELVNLVQKETGLIPTARGGNAGFFSVITAVTMRAKEIAMLGLNYSYETEDEVKRVTGGDHWVIMKDINQNYTYTTFDWLEARTEFIDFCTDFADNVRFVNCSEGGIIYERGVVESLPFSMWRDLYASSRATKRDCQ